MKKKTELFLLIIFIGVIYLFTNQLYGDRHHPGTGNEDTSDDENISGLALVEGQYAVRIPGSIQQKAGLEIGNPKPASIQPNIQTFGQVIDSQPLFKMRSDINNVQSELQIAKSELSGSTQEYERAKLLHSEASNISDRQLQVAKSRWLSDTAKVSSYKQKLEDLGNEAVQKWGKKIVDSMFSENSFFSDLQSGNAVLILVTLSADQHFPDDIEKIYVRRSGDTEHKQEAYYISPAMHTNHLLQGETYYFYSNSGELRNGMHLDVWLRTSDSMLNGYTIPESAIVWYVDIPWVYIKKDDQTYYRKALTSFIENKEGWFINEGISDNDQIVIKGGQMLLSEEFRWSIPDEDDNP